MDSDEWFNVLGNCEKPTVVPSPFRGLRVLLVDSDTSSLSHIASVLEQQSYRVTVTDSAGVALSMLEDNDQFDLVMADAQIPETDAIKFIKNIQNIRDTPIILMSSQVRREMVVEAMMEGACFVLEKPISKEQLKNVWQHVFRKRRWQELESKKPETHDQEEVGSPRERMGAFKSENVKDRVGGRGLKRKRTDENQGTSEKTLPILRTPGVRGKFSETVKGPGQKDAGSTQAMEMMNVASPTHPQFSRHLQECSVQLPDPPAISRGSVYSRDFSWISLAKNPNLNLLDGAKTVKNAHGQITKRRENVNLPNNLLLNANKKNYP